MLYIRPPGRVAAGWSSGGDRWPATRQRWPSLVDHDRPIPIGTQERNLGRAQQGDRLRLGLPVLVAPSMLATASRVLTPLRAIRPVAAAAMRQRAPCSRRFQLQDRPLHQRRSLCSASPGGRTEVVVLEADARCCSPRTNPPGPEERPRTDRNPLDPPWPVRRLDGQDDVRSRNSSTASGIVGTCARSRTPGTPA